MLGFKLGKGYGFALAVGAALAGSVAANVTLLRLLFNQRESIGEALEVLDSAGDGIAEIRRAMKGNNEADGSISVEDAISGVEDDVNCAHAILFGAYDFGVKCCYGGLCCCDDECECGECGSAAECGCDCCDCGCGGINDEDSES